MKGLFYWPRASRFAAHCRDVAGAAAEIEESPCVYHPGLRKQYQMRECTPTILQCIAHPAEDFHISEAPSATSLALPKLDPKVGQG